MPAGGGTYLRWEVRGGELEGQAKRQAPGERWEAAPLACGRRVHLTLLCNECYALD